MFPYYKDKGDESLFQLQNLKNVSCQNNCHFAMEVVIVLSGVLTVTLDDVAYDMKRRDVMLIMSYQIHSFHTKAESESVILNISKDFFRDHKKHTKHKNRRIRYRPFRTRILPTFSSI